MERRVEVEKLLVPWEENYKKGQPAPLMLLVLREWEAHAFEMADVVGKLGRGTVTADENSLYWALNRFERMGIVESSRRESETGRLIPAWDIGTAVLPRALDRGAAGGEALVGPMRK